MAYSQIDPSKIISSDKWVVSLIVRPTQMTPDLKHSQILIEGLIGGVRKTFAADFIPHFPPGAPRASLYQLLMAGTLNGKVRVAELKELAKLMNKGSTSTFREIYGENFSSKSWTVTRQNAIRMLDRINIDACRGLPGVSVPLYHFRIIGHLSNVTPDTVAGINCANWSLMVLREAEINDQGGVLLDLPLTLLLPGTRSDWIVGFLIGLGFVPTLIKRALYQK